jgi:hypothetical protein
VEGEVGGRGGGILGEEERKDEPQHTGRIGGKLAGR